MPARFSPRRSAADITIGALAFAAFSCAKAEPPAAPPAAAPTAVAPAPVAGEPAPVAAPVAAAAPIAPVAAGHDHAGHDHAGHDHAGHDHAGHDHGHEGGDKAHNCEEPDEAAVLDHAGVKGAPAAIEGKVYGAGVTDAPLVTISVLLGNVDAWVGKRVRVEGLVTEVCPMRGCWFDMAGDKAGATLRFKVKDGVMVFPLDAKGQKAVAEGVVRKIPLDLETSRKYMAHQAEEKSEPFDPASVKEPITIVRLDGTGAVLR